MINLLKLVNFLWTPTALLPDLPVTNCSYKLTQQNRSGFQLYFTSFLVKKLCNTSQIPLVVNICDTAAANHHRNISPSFNTFYYVREKEKRKNLRLQWHIGRKIIAGGDYTTYVLIMKVSAPPLTFLERFHILNRHQMLRCNKSECSVYLYKFLENLVKEHIYYN